jgi:hypothetical protein
MPELLKVYGEERAVVRFAPTDRVVFPVDTLTADQVERCLTAWRDQETNLLLLRHFARWQLSEAQRADLHAALRALGTFA